MKQYIDLLKAIEAKGTDKPAARPNMPGSRSLFGYQFRHDLSEGFPLLTTKKMYWKGIGTELLWFLRGDTNIKYLVDNGVNIWNGDAYRYYEELCKKEGLIPYDLESFLTLIDRECDSTQSVLYRKYGYSMGDCGFQYGKVWRNWQGEGKIVKEDNQIFVECPPIDQIKNVIKSLTENPESRRHIVTAVDPAHDTDLALYWCHSMFQFNCRAIQYFEGDSQTYGEVGSFYQWIVKPTSESSYYKFEKVEANSMKEILESDLFPTYFLDCQLYQRSADTILGVPFNIASYALLTHIIARLVNMVPGEFIHTFGDAHVYDNHKEALAENLSRIPGDLPQLKLGDIFYVSKDLDQLLPYLDVSDFGLEGYNPQEAIKAELSTG